MTKRPTRLTQALIPVAAGLALSACGQAPVFDGVLAGTATIPLTAGEAALEQEEQSTVSAPTAVIVWSVGELGDADHRHIIAASTSLKGDSLEDFELELPEVPPAEILNETDDGNLMATGMIMVVDHDPGVGEVELNHKQVLSVSDDVLVYLEEPIELDSSDAIVFAGPHTEGFHLLRIGLEVTVGENELAPPTLWMHSVKDNVEISRTDWQVFFSEEELAVYDQCVSAAYDSANLCWNGCGDLEPSNEELMNRCGSIQDEAESTRCFEDAYAPQSECSLDCEAQLTRDEKAC